MLGRGDGVERDPAKAVTWLKKAAEQNSPTAARTLAMCFLLGEGTPVSETDASYWFQRCHQITSGNRKKAESIADLLKKSEKNNRP